MLPEYEERLDVYFKDHYLPGHRLMEDWILVKIELNRLRSAEHVEQLQNTINDLTLSLGMWLEDYPFDDDHKAKQKQMINNACVLIGKPRTIEELKEMMGL